MFTCRDSERSTSTQEPTRRSTHRPQPLSAASHPQHCRGHTRFSHVKCWSTDRVQKEQYVQASVSYRTNRAVLKMERKTRPMLKVDPVSARVRPSSRVVPSRVRVPATAGETLVGFCHCQGQSRVLFVPSYTGKAFPPSAFLHLLQASGVDSAVFACASVCVWSDFQALTTELFQELSFASRSFENLWYR